MEPGTKRARPSAAPRRVSSSQDDGGLSVVRIKPLGAGGGGGELSAGVDGITSLHADVEDDVQKLVGIPDGASVVYCIPLGYPEGRFGPVSRKPLDEIVSVDKWGTTPDWV